MGIMMNETSFIQSVLKGMLSSSVIFRVRYYEHSFIAISILLEIFCELLLNLA